MPGKKDNVGYHGFAGHFFLRYIPNICKVRINTDMSLRIKKVAEKEGVSAMKAEKMIGKIDKARRKWCLHFYGIDAADADLYDMVFKVDNLNKKQVVDMIADAAQLPCFQISPQSREAMKDRPLTFEIEASLLGRFPFTGRNRPRTSFLRGWRWQRRGRVPGTGLTEGRASIGHSRVRR